MIQDCLHVTHLITILIAKHIERVGPLLSKAHCGCNSLNKYAIAIFFSFFLLLPGGKQSWFCHWLKHLGCNDDWFSGSIGHCDHLLLGDEYLNTKIILWNLFYRCWRYIVCKEELNIFLKVLRLLVMVRWVWAKRHWFPFYQYKRKWANEQTLFPFFFLTFSRVLLFSKIPVLND